MPQALLEPGAFLQHGDFLRRAGDRRGGKRRQRRVAVEAAAVPSARELVGGWIQLTHAGSVVAAPAQPARPRCRGLATVTAFHLACSGNVFELLVPKRGDGVEAL